MPLKAFQLRASNGNQVVLPVHVTPSQGQRLGGCPKSAIPRQADDRLPLDIVLAYGQNAVNHLAADELPTGGVATNGNFDLLMDERVLLNKPPVDGGGEELASPRSTASRCARFSSSVGSLRTTRFGPYSSRRTTRDAEACPLAGKGEASRSISFLFSFLFWFLLGGPIGAFGVGS